MVCLDQESRRGLLPAKSKDGRGYGGAQEPLSVPLPSGELGFPMGRSISNQTLLPCTLCVGLAGIPVCQVQSQFRTVVPGQLELPLLL